MSQVLEKPILLDETGQEIVEKLDDIKDAIGTSSEFIPVMIKVVTPPTKTTYLVGERLSLSGLVINLVGTNGVQIDVTSACTYNPVDGTPMTASDTSVAVSYYYAAGDLTFTTTIPVGVKSLNSISVTTPPTETSYKAGETLDLTGIVVTALYDDGSTLNVTQGCTFSPANGATLFANDTTLTATYTEGSTTKTATQALDITYLSSITATTAPTTTEYFTGDDLDLTGIEITATYSDNTTEDVTSSCTFSPADGATITDSDTSVTVSYTEAGITKTATQAIEVTPIYGVEWDGTATTAFTRTDSAVNFVDPVAQFGDGQGGLVGGSSPFDNISPWQDMVIINHGFGKQVIIPKFYYKLTQNGTGIKIQISMKQFTGSHVSPAHMDRGDGVGERDNVYVMRYMMNSQKQSSSGSTPYTNQTRATLRSQIQSQYSSYPEVQMMDFSMLFTIWLLYLVEYADWNSQEKIGYGCTADSVSQVKMTGITDSEMTYHTGTPYPTGQYYYAMQYRNIENLWSNVFTFVEGCRNYSDGFYVILNPSEYSDTANGIKVGMPSIDGSYVTGLTVVDPEGLFPVFYPTAESGGSGSTYICDQWHFYNYSEQCVYTGGSYKTKSQAFGMFYMNKGATSFKDNYTGVRLMRIPANS